MYVNFPLHGRCNTNNRVEYPNSWRPNASSFGHVLARHGTRPHTRRLHRSCAVEASDGVAAICRSNAAICPTAVKGAISGLQRAYLCQQSECSMLTLAKSPQRRGIHWISGLPSRSGCSLSWRCPIHFACWRGGALGSLPPAGVPSRIPDHPSGRCHSNWQ